MVLQIYMEVSASGKNLDKRLVYKFKSEKGLIVLFLLKNTPTARIGSCSK